MLDVQFADFCGNFAASSPRPQASWPVSGWLKTRTAHKIESLVVQRAAGFFPVLPVPGPQAVDAVYRYGNARYNHVGMRIFA